MEKRRNNIFPMTRKRCLERGREWSELVFASDRTRNHGLELHWQKQTLGTSKPQCYRICIYICRNTLPRSWGGGGISITGVPWGQVRQTLVRNGLGIEVEWILPCGRRLTSSVFLNLSTLQDHPAFWESEAGYLVPQRFSLTSKRRLDCLFSSSSFYLPAFRDYVCAFSFRFFFPVVPQHIFDVSQAVVIHQTGWEQTPLPQNYPGTYKKRNCAAVLQLKPFWQLNCERVNISLVNFLVYSSGFYSVSQPAPMPWRAASQPLSASQTFLPLI